MLNLTSEPILSYADNSTLCNSFSFKTYPSIGLQQVDLVDSRNYISRTLEEGIYSVLI